MKHGALPAWKASAFCRLGRILDDVVVTNGSQKIANDASGEVGGTTLLQTLASPVPTVPEM